MTSITDPALWGPTYLVMHFLAMGCAIYLARRTPDSLQFGIVCLMLVAMAVYIVADLVMMSGEPRAWMVRFIASTVEHIGVLLYLFRQVWIKTETCQLLKSSR